MPSVLPQQHQAFNPELPEGNDRSVIIEVHRHPPKLLHHHDAMDQRRRDLHVKLSPAAHEGWVSFAAAHGGTITSTMEAIGGYLAGMDEESEGRLPAHVRDWIRTSRRLAATSRRRGER